MSADLTQGVVAILNRQGDIAGTGYLVSRQERYVVTCAHVLNDAGYEAGDRVSVRCYASGQVLSAKIQQKYWRDPAAEDVAILELESEPALQPSPLLGPLPAKLGRPVQGFGFPYLDKVEGIAGPASVIKLVKEAEHSRLQLESSAITSGFSGGPVLDLELGWVIGIIVKIARPDLQGRLTNVAFAIPAETIRSICPAVDWHEHVPANAVPYQRAAVWLALTCLLLPAGFLYALHLLEGFRPAHYLLAGLIALVPPAIGLALKGIPAWRLFRRSNQLRAAALRGSEPKPGYFSLSPYGDSPDDQRRFTRPDDAHVEVLRWLEQSAEPVLYLTGRSGTGKTSLLNAYVIPRLRQSAPPVRAVTPRGFADPLDALERQLRRPGVVWDQPPDHAASLAGRALLQAASDHLQSVGQRLLLVLDQFEELLIVQEREPERVARVMTFLEELAQRPIAAAQVLLSLRSDYLGMLDSPKLPALTSGRNWREVPAFTEPAARAFLVRSGSKTIEVQVEGVVAEACKLEGTRGYVRPIVLNMLGGVISRQSAPLTADPSTWLLDDLRGLLNAAEIVGIAEPILRLMLTAEGTKQPCSVGDLSAKTGIDEGTVEGCLLQLSVSGLVRRIDSSPVLVARAWEVAHDFVARLLDQLFNSSRHLLIRWLHAYAFPASLILYALFALYVTYSPQLATHQLVGGFGASIHRISNGYEVRMFGGSRTSLSPAAGPLRALGDVHTLSLSNCHDLLDVDNLAPQPGLRELTLVNCPKLKNVDGLHGLSDLKSLSLDCSSLANLNGLRGLTNLDRLELKYCKVLQELAPLRDCPQLSSLTLTHCSSLAHLNGLESLARLEWLVLEDCTGLTSIEALSGHRRLRFLTLDRCEKLADLDALGSLTNLNGLSTEAASALTSSRPLKTLTKLQFLHLDRCAGLREVSNLAGLKNLDELTINGCVMLTSLEGLQGLPKLRSLQASGCKSLKNLSGLKSLPNLEWLILSDCGELESTAGLGGLTSLERLHLGSCYKLKQIEDLGTLIGLKTLGLHDCAGLTDLDGIQVLKKLESLDLTGCQSLRSLEGVKQLKQLKELLVPHALLTDELRQALPSTRIRSERSLRYVDP